MFVLFLASLAFTSISVASPRPNIVWIIAEDASPHIGPYGKRLIDTPAFDRLAREGITFTQAFTTAPVCSPSRSALISGMMQTTLGAHNHESNIASPELGGDASFYPSYRTAPSIKLIPELFADAGYYVVNGGTAKTHYNFVPRTTLYSGSDWSGRAAGQPFFAQIQLRGGKGDGLPEAGATNPASVVLPSYLPDDPVLRKDWAEYLDNWKATDREVGAILARLEQEGVLEETAVFFLTDHGISHLRAKQFLYDEGLHIPLLVRLPGGRAANTRRTELVSHLDIAAASLALAGIPMPDYVQGRALFADDHQPRTAVVSARDRCDETVDLIRSVRTARFRYIRNFMSYRPHMQANQYKDGKTITKTMRRLHAADRLTELQDRLFLPTRPTEELYDVENDPEQLTNLADDPAFESVRTGLREQLYQTLVDQRDAGLIPEPILDEMARAVGSKYAVLLQPENNGLVRIIIDTIEAGERKDLETLRAAIASPMPAVRYWAAVWLGQHRDQAARQALIRRLQDDSGAVRVAAAESLYGLGDHALAMNTLERALHDSNHNTAFYAVRAWEAIGAPVDQFLPLVRQSPHARYEYIKRVVRRLGSSRHPRIE